jgi:hypothetical protein
MEKLSKANKGVKYLLVMVNSFNKMMYVETLQSKESLEVSAKLEKLLSQIKCRKFRTDQGIKIYFMQIKMIML